MNDDVPDPDSERGGLSPEETAEFSRLYQRYAASVRRYLSRRVFQPDDAEDLAGEAWSKAAQSFSLDRVPYFQQWIITIARNCYVDWVRRQVKGPETLPEDYDPSSSESDIPHLDEERVDAVRECLETVREPFRSALRARLAECSYQEISDRYSIPVKTVGTQLNRARKLVRACVEGKLK